MQFPVHLTSTIMLDKWFGAGPAKQFGTQIAMLLVQRAAIEAEKSTRSKSAKKGEKRFDATLLSIEKQLAEFRTIHRLNVYSKAQLGSSFKFTLLDHGFESDVADNMTTWLLLRCK
ncbi:MAG: hypothetical protein EON54_00515 [Alcaligenaceae bacterium]|nr:MAG: hypothetical protein EON54_00515 [Alcaligenaceae bacterium]